MLPPIHQDQKTAVIDHPMQPPDPWARGPTDLAIPALDMRRRSAERDRGHPPALDLGHVAQLAAPGPGTVHVMLLFQQFIEPAVVVPR